MSAPARSFFVGGRRVRDGDGGHTVVDQMYVRRLGDSQDARLPVVLFHGGAQSGAHYEHTRTVGLAWANCSPGTGGRCTSSTCPASAARDTTPPSRDP